ncbi:YxiC [Niallia circulans]|jgi:galactitol-specific phosphotransferase system IIB component|uniref:YwqI/YxiC family protein n=1 Tax=Niallia circulans TaxID=1397 RepID=A0A0J1IL49_NIACI|nr:DUF5344 family protein [Niallia circulans]KLV26717.1 hypothetical protein ABW02_09210 [Niallia circulans]MDR4317065.1 hypothetical protein [Niallia circulans]MED3838045.1 DUF5344 family protein [Niallia circulans]MED4241625.1 DUF5344 family protein [Niallia circulans]MED4247257.1 DUF5344 family protein [Niallia circulans]
MGEIKFDYSGIESVLKKMDTNITAFQANLPENNAKNNKLDLLTELEEVNASFVKIINEYKTLLLKNASTVRSSVTLMRETDEALRDAISSEVLR